MTVPELVKLVEVLPVIRANTLKTAAMHKALTQHASRIADEVATRFDWDFVCDVADETTVANQADYTLAGNNKDCRDIINIRYKGAGTASLTLLTKYRPVDMDERLSGADPNTGEVVAWIVKGRSSNGYPIVTFSASPGSAGDTIRYRYRKRNISMGDFSDEFAPVLQYSLIAKMTPSYAAIAERELQFMVDRYAAPGGEANPAQLDAQLQLRNRERAGKFGYS